MPGIFNLLRDIQRNKWVSPNEEPWFIEAVKTVSLSLLLAFGIRTFVAEARFIP